ncbi:MAG TPA: hypothetical protein VNJ01_06605 [Bacteriovoracaceae bacterium]|nr:hypothetical protein [Bacteriovoracaceae bacterium]
MKKMSRMECSKEVRRVLNRYHVDLSHCQYSVSGRDIRMTGWLFKTDGSDFNGQQLESMIQDFQQALSGFSVNGSLENWNFSSDHISAVSKNKDKEESEQKVEEPELKKAS